MQQRIVIAARRDRGRAAWLTCLTDGAAVTRRRLDGSATVALTRVRRHLAAGHAPAFASALRDLTREALAEHPPAAMAAD